MCRNLHYWLKVFMKTNLPTAICLINYFFECLSGFYKIKYANFNVCFEDLAETSEEGLTIVCAVSSRGCMCGFSLIKYANFLCFFWGFTGNGTTLCYNCLSDRLISEELCANNLSNKTTFVQEAYTWQFSALV